MMRKGEDLDSNLLAATSIENYLFKMKAKDTNLLKRLYWAQGDIQSARELCEHMIQNADEFEQRWVWRAMESGVVISYARPFGENTGIGKLPNRYQLFDDPKLLSAHKRLLRARDVVVAHNNIFERLSVLLSHVSEDEATKVSIEISTDGQSSWSIPVPHLEVPHIQFVAELCRFQELRLSRESTAMLENFTKGCSYEAGTYGLGVDFP
jgi:hypothetical protein